MSKKSKQKAQETETEKKGSNGGSVYDGALDELKQLANNETYRRKIEGSVVHEARGHDDWGLHTTITAIDTTHRNLASDVEEFQTKTNQNFQKTWDAVSDKFEKTWDTLGTKFDKTLETVDKDFEKTWDTLGNKFDKTWESIGHNFDATNERTQREITDLRDEITKILDRRFTHIDQTFASIRADIEVLKALQMELIKERIGRPELLKR